MTAPIATLVAGPRTRLPARRPGSVRRTQCTRIAPRPSWDVGFDLSGVGRDVAIDEAGRSHALHTQRMTAVVGAQSGIRRLEAPLAPAVLERLRAASREAGFRSVLADLTEADPSWPVTGLLFDLPTVTLVSGYARLMTSPFPPDGSHPRLNVCRGWAEGATAHRRAVARESLVDTTTPAPPLAQMVGHPDDFPDDPPPVPNSMMRRRMVDVWTTDSGHCIYEYFRDSYVDRHGTEGSLHEYDVLVETDPDLVLTTVAVTPRALPFRECPLAALRAVDLVGASLEDLTAAVRTRLSGVRGCTHLSDSVRYLQYCVPLIRALRDQAARS